MTKTFETIYENTKENAENLGWKRWPEHCQGDTSARFVIHNHRTGKFLFTDKV